MLPLPQVTRQAKEEDAKIHCSEPTKTVPISHSTQKSQIPASTSPESVDYEDQSCKNDPHQHANLFTTSITVY
ncbi:unnamed protein product [Hymenolepis diminuta]|uniref:Ovule protein n=1 Tax=Hymenolepis diminuta TaxID=6216 RepID=A0A0R3SRB4_HYMDI|nr:unnamed protein product [Hymenolepis diminuta]